MEMPTGARPGTATNLRCVSPSGPASYAQRRGKVPPGTGAGPLIRTFPRTWSRLPVCSGLNTFSIPYGRLHVQAQPSKKARFPGKTARPRSSARGSDVAEIGPGSHRRLAEGCTPDFWVRLWRSAGPSMVRTFPTGQFPVAVPQHQQRTRAGMENGFRSNQKIWRAPLAEKRNPRILGLGYPRQGTVPAVLFCRFSVNSIMRVTASS